MCATTVAPREAPRNSAPARAGGPAPIYIVCSPSRQVGKTLVARLITEHHLADRRTIAAFDLADEPPQLADYLRIPANADSDSDRLRTAIPIDRGQRSGDRGQRLPSTT